MGGLLGVERRYLVGRATNVYIALGLVARGSPVMKLSWVLAYDIA